MLDLSCFLKLSIFHSIPCNKNSRDHKNLDNKKFSTWQEKPLRFCMKIAFTVCMKQWSLCCLNWGKKKRRTFRRRLTLHKSLDSDDDFHSGCRNISQCDHHKQSFSGLNTHPDNQLLLHLVMIRLLGSNHLLIYDSEEGYNFDNNENDNDDGKWWWQLEQWWYRGR